MSNKKLSNKLQDTHTADALIKNSGSRATRARLSVLEVLLAADHALTHAELEQSLNSSIERVTLYRVLEWLVSNELAHKVIGADRVWRFNAQSESIPRHAHFNCSSCGKVFCLDDTSPMGSLDLPPGFSLGSAELSVSGLCSQCNHTP